MSALLDDFDAGKLDPAGFSHRDHLQVAFEALEEDEFFTACARVARGLRRLAETAGVPEKYNATVTLGFMSLVAEHKQPGQGVEAFLDTCPDLLSGALNRHYSSQRLAHPRARTVGLLPEARA